MASFLWLIPQEGTLALRNELPRKLIIPHAQVSGLQSRVKGETIWIVDSNEGWLLAKVMVSQIMQFVEGINKGDFLIHVDYSHSFRVGPQSLMIKESLISFKPGLNESTDILNNSWNRQVINLVETRFVEPKVEAFKIPFQQLTEDTTIGIEDTAMVFLIQRMSVNEVWRHERKSALGPYATFALALCRACGLTLMEDQAQYLDQLDPISQAVQIPDTNYINTKSKRVDLFFSKIDSTQVKFRRFTDIGLTTDKTSAISKLNDAERRHQQILLWLSEFLSSIELIPKQSNSVDLLVNKGTSTLLCEIKTIHEENLESQVAKGVYQVIKYELAMAGRFGEVSPVVILEGRTTKENLIQTEKVLERLGIDFIWVGDSKSDGLCTNKFHSLLKKRLDL